mgnify:CR=1 FL=1
MSGECDACGEHTMDCGGDVVNNPSHYKGKSLECIDVIEDFQLNFCLGNAIKYILRAGKKGERNEDLQKAIWYLTRALDEPERV